MIRRWLAAAVILSLHPPALARLAANAQVDPEIHAWFERQHSAAGAWCCDVSDGHMLSDSEWRVVADHYEVLIDGAWRLIDDSHLRDPNGGPNPTGQAVIWFLPSENGPHIYCFAPGQFY